MKQFIGLVLFFGLLLGIGGFLETLDVKHPLIVWCVIVALGYGVWVLIKKEFLEHS